MFTTTTTTTIIIIIIIIIINRAQGTQINRTCTHIKNKNYKLKFMPRSSQLQTY